MVVLRLHTPTTYNASQQCIILGEGSGLNKGKWKSISPVGVGRMGRDEDVNFWSFLVFKTINIVASKHKVIMPLNCLLLTCFIDAQQYNMPVLGKKNQLYN